MKKFLQLFFATALLLGTQAYAAPITQPQDISQAVVDTTDELLDAWSIDFGRTFSTTAPLGEGNNAFSDRYAFTLDGSYQAIGLLTSYLRTDGTGLVITGFNLRNDNGGLLANGALSPIFGANAQGWLFDGAGTLAAGTYFVEVNGYATFAQGSYSGVLEISPVPEPGSLALMLGGLAVMGVVMRRRRA